MMFHSMRRAQLVKLVLRGGLPITIMVLCISALAPHFTYQLLHSIPSQMAEIPVTAWIGAIFFTLVSLWTIGRYDGVAHQHFATRVPAHQARLAGTISIALAQTLGFGLFTGALARWRILSDFSFKKSLQLSAFVSFSFMICWAVFTAFTCLVLQGPQWATVPSIIIVILAPVALLAMFRWPTFSFKSHRFQFPNLKSSGAILFWTMIDTTAVAAAMFMLLPSAADISFSVFLPLFLLALGTALLSNTPGGVGPFELMMLGLLPYLPASEVLGSIIAFRIVYYAIPAAISLLALARPFARNIDRPEHPGFALLNYGQAEVQVITQNGGHLLRTSNGACAVWPTAQTVTALSNPIAGTMQTCIDALHSEATALGKIPFAYKCNPRSALELRLHGWSMIHMSDDAIIFPQTFNLASPSLRRLRRKLRSAQKADVIIRTEGSIPWSELGGVDQEWQQIHGTARGGTMGRFEQGYLSNHFIARAEIQGRICAFVSFQRGANEWCLDVMRHTKELPDGTMQSLVHSGIVAATKAGIERVSLAATPACPDPNSAFFRWAARHAVIKAGGTGLRQFKSAFAPTWEPRYAAAPNPLSLVIGLADIGREVHHPNPLSITKAHEIHNFDEYYEVASRKAS